MAHALPAILTYHSQNIAGSATGDNDHVALAADLEALHAAGFQIRPLDTLLDHLDRGGRPETLDRHVFLTFDDGCDFDVRDLEWPGQGLQRSMLGILRDFIRRHGAAAQPGLHATSFVIACPEARETIDHGSLFGKGWMSEDWWPVARQTGLLSIGNHGWDHNHPDLAPADAGRGGFAHIDTQAAADAQIVRAARYIEAVTGAWPRVFAYPFGESNAYLREDYFPRRVADHRTRAAVGTDPGPVTADSDHWNLPRFVCGRDWQSPQALLERLSLS